jgi:hexokinase
MKISNSARYALGICATIAILTGCGPQTPIGALGAIPQMQTSPRSALRTAAEAPATNSNLYVANHNGSTGFVGGNVTVYAPGKTKVLRTISKL